MSAAQVQLLVCFALIGCSNPRPPAEPTVSFSPAECTAAPTGVTKEEIYRSGCNLYSNGSMLMGALCISPRYSTRTVAEIKTTCSSTSFVVKPD